MKHATTPALDAIEPLLVELRLLEGLTERKRGVFYRRSQAFLHFHEDPAGFFADLRAPDAWRRLPATTPADHDALLSQASAILVLTVPTRRLGRP